MPTLPDGVMHQAGADGVLVICFAGVGEDFYWAKRIARRGHSGLHIKDKRFRRYMDGCDGLDGADAMVGLIRDVIGATAPPSTRQGPGGWTLCSTP